MKSQQGFIIGRLLTIIGLGFIFLVLLFFSRFAQEGQTLYPLRILGEQIETAIIPSEDYKINAKIDRLNNRSIGLRKTADEQDYPKLTNKAEEFKKEADNINNDINKLAETGKDTKEHKANLKAVIENQLCGLGSAALDAHGEEREKIKQLINDLQNLL